MLNFLMFVVVVVVVVVAVAAAVVVVVAAAAAAVAAAVTKNPSTNQGVHYRTKRNFASNIRIIMNVNRALGGVLTEMRGRMRKIDGNLERVKRNIEYLEDMYEGVFRKVNRLIVN